MNVAVLGLMCPQYLLTLTPTELSPLLKLLIHQLFCLSELPENPLASQWVGHTGEMTCLWTFLHFVICRGAEGPLGGVRPQALPWAGEGGAQSKKRGPDPSSHRGLEGGHGPGHWLL